MQDLHPEVAKAAPGVIGALLASLWSKESPVRAFVLFMAGTALAYIVGGWLAKQMGIATEVAGFVAGAYGIAVVNKGFEALQQFPLGQLLTDWAKSKLPKD